MLNKVKETIQKFDLIDENDKVVVGVSGGPDSLCLLHILYTLKYNIVVCHINHGLRENANIDEKFVADFCDKHGIQYFIKRVNLSDKNTLNGMSTEEAGRKVRYDFFKEIMLKEGASKIATAHNLNDNIETILLNIFRGSGVIGLKGIEANSGKIIRPLIECSREEIETYCRNNDLKPRHDESNDDTKYTRNKVRLELLPYIEKNINSNVSSAVLRMSQIVSEEEDFAEYEINKAYEEISIIDENKVVISLKKFNQLHNFLKKRIILKAIYGVLGNTKDIGKVHIDDIVKMCENNIGGKFLTPNKNVRVSILNHKIIVEKLNKGDA